MQRYRVTGIKQVLGSGLLVQLTDAQATVHLNDLSSFGNDLYEITSPIELKTCEEFGYGSVIESLDVEILNPAASAESPAEEAESTAPPIAGAPVEQVEPPAAPTEVIGFEFEPDFLEEHHKIKHRPKTT